MRSPGAATRARCTADDDKQHHDNDIVIVIVISPKSPARRFAEEEAWGATLREVCRPNRRLERFLQRIPLLTMNYGYAVRRTYAGAGLVRCVVCLAPSSAFFDVEHDVVAVRAFRRRRCTGV